MPMNLSNLFSAAKKVPIKEGLSGSPPPPKLATQKSVLCVLFGPSSTSSSSPEASLAGSLTKPGGSKPKKASPAVSPRVLSRLKQATLKNSKKSVSPPESDDSALEISRTISSILRGKSETSEVPSSKPSDVMPLKDILDNTWFSNTSKTSTTQWRKEVLRERKQKYIFKKVESQRFTKLMKMCANKLGTDCTIELFDKLGRETGVKEYSTLIKLSIDKARCNNDKEASLVELRKAYQLLLSMKEKGFEIEEESYGPFLQYMVDMKMTEEFKLFVEFFKYENPESCSMMSYYEMLLWIRVGDEGKIYESCNYVGLTTSKDRQIVAENYVLAFCKNDRKEELLQLLEVLGVRNISSLNNVSTIFKSLGRLQLQNFAEKYLLELKTAGTVNGHVSILVYDYVTSIPNLEVEEVVSSFIQLHKKLGLLPAFSSCNKLISFCCNVCKVHVALDIVNYMHEYGLSIPIDTFEPMLQACGQSCDLNMVYSIRSMMQWRNLKPKGEILQKMIGLYVKLKDFEGAYNLLTDLEEMNDVPTSGMYNAILAGYYREKNTYGALMVLKQMEDANIKPDAETFSYLINNCESVEEIIKYRNQMHHAGVRVSKHVYMGLINAYANLQNFEIAKQIVLDHDIPSKYLNEIKSALVSALSSNGQIFDALSVYDEIKQSKGNIEPKAVISLIEHTQMVGELDRLLQLLQELTDSSSWFDGCSRVIMYCVRHNISDTAIELIKQLKEKDLSSTTIVIDQIFSQIWETTANLTMGLDILRAVKELGFHPSRTTLDFLLSTCAKAKDSKSAQLVWSEYKDANLSYNVLSYLRMYQSLLASGDCNGAKEFLKEIRQEEDPHVRSIVKSCKVAYYHHFEK